MALNARWMRHELCPLLAKSRHYWPYRFMSAFGGKVDIQTGFSLDVLCSFNEFEGKFD